jgi:hypothetical protein
MIEEGEVARFGPSEKMRPGELNAALVRSNPTAAPRGGSVAGRQRSANPDQVTTQVVLTPRACAHARAQGSVLIDDRDRWPEGRPPVCGHLGSRPPRRLYSTVHHCVQALYVLRHAT